MLQRKNDDLSRLNQKEQEIIKILNKHIRTLMVYISKIGVNQWDSILRIEGLDNEFYYKDEKEKLESQCQTIALVAVTQLLFYTCVRSLTLKNLNYNIPKLVPLSKANGNPVELQNLLKIMKEKSVQKTLYDYEIFSKLPKNINNRLFEITQNLEELTSNFIFEKDILGTIFQQILPISLRKKISAYYTKSIAAKLLSYLMIEFYDEIVFDPACGSGTLLVQSYLRKKQLAGNNIQSSTLKREIAGCDIALWACILTNLNLVIQDFEIITKDILIINEDAFNLLHLDLEDSFNLEFFTEKKIEINNNRRLSILDIISPKIILANPPYTKGERLTSKERNKLTELSKFYGLNHGWKRWNLYASFLLLAHELIAKKKGGKIGLILPYAAISTEFMEQVWKRIFEKTKLGVKFIINADQTEKSFSDSGEQEIILGLEQGYNLPVKMIQLQRPLSEYDIYALKKNILNIKKVTFRNKFFEGQLINQDIFKITPSRLWFFKPNMLIEQIQKDFVEIEQINFVKLGQENINSPTSYFYLPNKYWNIVKDNDNSIIIKRSITALESLPKIKDRLRKSLRKLSKLEKTLQNCESINQIQNHMIIRDHLKDYKLLLNEYKQKNVKNEQDGIIRVIKEQKIRLKEASQFIMLFKNRKEISIPKKYLVKCMPRKIDDLNDFPSYLIDDIPVNYLIDYSKLLASKEEMYYKWGELCKILVNNWVWAKPRPATVFIIKRVGLKSNKTLVLATKRALVNTRFTSVIFIPNKKSIIVKKYTKLLFAYLSSSIFLYDYICKSRVDSGAFRRIYATDVRSKMKFPNLKSLSTESKRKIYNAAREYNKTSLAQRDNFYNAIINALRPNSDSLLKKLDETWFNALQMPIENLSTLYLSILKELRKL